MLSGYSYFIIFPGLKGDTDAETLLICQQIQYLFWLTEIKIDAHLIQRQHNTKITCSALMPQHKNEQNQGKQHTQGNLSHCTCYKYT